MKITIVSGSHRKVSESERVARFVADTLKSKGATPSILSLAGNPLPLWDEGVWNDDPKWTELWSPIAKGLQESDGFVIVSPEWSGMVPAGLKNFFLLCSSRELGHKPGLIITVSSGMGGSYPVSELRASSYKNTRIVYIPDHILVRHAATMLQGDTPANEHDESLRKRIGYSVSVLLEYAKAMRGVRESGVIDYKSYPNGM